MNKRKIPSKLDVIARVLFRTGTEKESLSVAIDNVVNETMQIWSERRRSTELCLKRSIARSIYRLHKDYVKVKSNCHRNTEKAIETRKRYLLSIEEEFDIENRAENEPEKDESEEDVSTSGKRADEKSEPIEYKSDSSAYTDSSSGSVNDDPDYIPPVKKFARNKFKLSPEAVQSIDVAGVSNYCATSIVLTIAKMFGIQLDLVNASEATIRRNREKIRAKISEKVKEKFGEDVQNKFVVLHFDGKILPKWSKVDGKTDRLAVVVTCGKESKILGVAELPNGKAVHQFNVIVRLVEDWGLTPYIKAICSDTTSTNSGSIKGVNERLRRKYFNNILTLMCRHHISEIVISRVYSLTMNENTTSPNIVLFERFQNAWTTIDTSRYESAMNIQKVKKAITDKEKEDICKFVKHQLELQNKTRKDYVEFLQLVLLFLGDNKKIHIRSPGAMHRARFMARVIYGLKIILFRRQFALNSKFVTKTKCK